MRPQGNKSTGAENPRAATQILIWDDLAAKYARKITLLLIGAMLFFVPIIINAFMKTANPTGHSKELAARFLLAAIGTAAVLAFPRFSRGQWHLAEFAALGYACVCSLSALLSGRAGYCFYQTWHLWAFICLSVVLARLQPSRRELRTTVSVLAVTAVLVLIYGFAKYFGHDFLAKIYPFEASVEGRAYIHSFLGNPEYFGGYMTPLGVIAFSRGLRRDLSIVAACCWMGLVLIILLAVGLSGSRGAILGFAAGAAAVLWSQGRLLAKRAQKQMLVAGAIGSAGIALAVVILSTPNPLNVRNTRLAQRFAEAADLNSNSVRERILFYTLAARMVPEHPILGSGPSTFQLRFYPTLDKMIREDPHAGTTVFAQDLRGRMANEVHCDYLQVWVETGTVGLAALLLTIAAVVARFYRGAPRPSKGPLSNHALDTAALRAGFFGAALCSFTNALFSFPLQLPARASLTWCCVGLFLAADTLLQQKRLQLKAQIRDEIA